jgi:hypothetical protein
MAPTLPPQSELASLFQRLFQPEPVLKLAQKVDFVVRQRKLQPFLFALALTVATLSKQRKTYKQIVADMHSVGGQLITPQSFQERLSLPGAAFLLELLRQPLRLLADNSAPTFPDVPDWLKPFSGVWATDSTVFGLPSALAALFPHQGGAPGSAGMKLHLSLDVLGAQLRGFRFDAGRAPEGLATEVTHHPPGLLHLLDKGFGKCRTLLYQIDRAKQSFITPLWVPMPLYDERGHKLDVEELCRACEATGKLDVWVYLGNPLDPGDLAVKVRLVGVRVPEAVAEQRRRRAKKEAKARGHAVKARTLRLKAWTLLVTNVPKNKLTQQQVLLGYRLRWQVELMFRRWKHLYGMRAPGYKKPESLYCHLIATLVAAALISLIQRVMFRQWDPTQEAEPSPYQITALFVGQGELWLLALGGTEEHPLRRQLLERLLQAVLILGRMEKRQRVSTRRSLLMGGNRATRPSRRRSSLT